MTNPDLTGATWRKSTWSGGNNGNCVEVALTGGIAAVRDTKNRAGGHLAVQGREWSAFIAGVKAGQFDGG